MFDVFLERVNEMLEVLLVDENNRGLGRMEKLEAHEKACLHRAFSVFLIHDGKMLIQKRALSKYHCPGIWTNICCSHPLEGEVIPYALQRLKEEVGIEQVELEEVGTMIYKAEFDNGLTEYEYDHLLLGKYDGDVLINPEEVAEVRRLEFAELKEEIEKNPQLFTPWFKLALDQVLEKI